MAKSKREKAPKGWFVNPPADIKSMILARCEESMREPRQEIVWLLRDWMRREEERQVRAKEALEAEAEVRSEAPPGVDSASVTEFKKSMVGREP